MTHEIQERLWIADDGSWGSGEILLIDPKTLSEKQLVQFIELVSTENNLKIDNVLNLLGGDAIDQRT